jgi:hypothetical protein
MKLLQCSFLCNTTPAVSFVIVPQQFPGGAKENYDKFIQLVSRPRLLKNQNFPKKIQEC